MLGSVYLKTLRDLREQIVAWSLGLAALGAINVLLYPTVQNMPGLVSFLDNLPEAVKAMIGDVRAMARLEGFLKAKIFDQLPLLLALFGVSHGARLIAGEVEKKSIDLLMAQPIRRWRVVVEKYLAIASATVILCAALVASLVVCTVLIDGQVSTAHLVLATCAGLPLTWLFTAVALLGSCVLSRARQAALLAGIVVVASYVFETMRLLSPALSGWRSVSPFAHHKAAYSLAGELSVTPILLLVGITVVLVTGAATAWERRDLVG